MSASASTGGDYDPNCSRGYINRFVSVGCIYGTLDQFAVFATWNNNTMTVDAAQANLGKSVRHLLSLDSGSPCALFLEVGVAAGGESQNSGNLGYHYYYAWNRTDTGFGSFWAQNTTMLGQTNEYEISYAGPDQFGTGFYIAFRGGTQVASTGSLGYGGGCVGRTGLESDMAPSGTYHTDTFGAINLAWEDRSQFRHEGWLGQGNVDYPCTSFPNPDCFNGLYYGSNHWSSNKL